jgi:hypothetical protein
VDEPPIPDSGRLAGLITTAELTRAGITKARIQTLTSRRILVSAGRGVYVKAAQASVLAKTPIGSVALRVAKALIVTGPQAAGSHLDAAVIHRLDTLSRLPKDKVAVTRAPETPHSRRTRAGITLHIASIPSDHCATDLGLRLTSVARTVVDLGRSGTFAEGVVVADSALRAKLTSPAQLATVLEYCGNWPGIRQARQVVAFSDARSESAFESLARVEFHRGGLPPPELQAWVGGDGVVVGRADFLWRQYSTIAEADGAMKYADPDRARMQLRRDADLRAAGFEVVHFNWQELRLNPAQVIARIRAAFARSAALRIGEAVRSSGAG